MRRACRPVRGLILIGILAAVAAGCGSQTIPSLAVEGTTVTLAIPMEFEVGYGRKWVQSPTMDPAAAPAFDPQDVRLEDLQRGELRLVLQDPSGVLPDQALPVRLITRVTSDPAAQHRTDLSSDDLTGQNVVVFDLPQGLVSDGEPGGKRSFEIRVERYRRDSSNLDSYVHLPQSKFASILGADWFGWGSVPYASPEQFVPIEVADAPGADGSEVSHYTAFEGWGPIVTYLPDGSVNAAGIGPHPLLVADETLYIPNPEFEVALPADYAGTIPSAWEIEVEYPASRMAVLDVRLLRRTSSGAAALWSDSAATPALCTANQFDGLLKIKVVDPGQDPQERASGVGVVFRLINQGSFGPGCPGRVTPSDLKVRAGSERAFGEDGASLPDPGFVIQGTDLS